MIYGGKVFRVVTPNHPGCPKLDEAGAPAIRTEYLTGTEPLTWGLSRASAFFFPRHLDAVNLAKDIPHCHATVATDDQDLRVVTSGSSAGEVKQPDKVETLRRGLGTHRDSPCPQNSSQQDGAEAARLAHNQKVVGSSPTPAKLSKRSRMLKIRAAANRVDGNGTDGSNGTDAAQKFWWKQGAYA